MSDLLIKYGLPAAIIVLISLLVRRIIAARRRRAPPLSPSEPAAMAQQEGQPDDAPQHQAEQSPANRFNADERAARRAAEVRDLWARKRKAARDRLLAEMEPIHDRIAKAKELVELSGVGDAACNILKIMRHWPKWISNSGGRLRQWTPPLAVEGLDGGYLRGGEDRGHWVCWVLNGQTCRLELRRRSGSYSIDGDEFGELKLSVVGELVLHLDVSRKHDDEHDSWTVFGVSALRSGDWMEALNEFYGRLCVAKDQSVVDFKREFYGGKARNIDLSQA